MSVSGLKGINAAKQFKCIALILRARNIKGSFPACPTHLEPTVKWDIKGEHMKTWFITLLLPCSVGVAMANGIETERAADQMATVAALGKAQAQDRIYKHKSK
jgi:hypothetical protein